MIFFPQQSSTMLHFTAAYLQAVCVHHTADSGLGKKRNETYAGAENKI